VAAFVACRGCGCRQLSGMRMVKALVAHSEAGVAAGEEGWFLLLEEKTCGGEGQAHGGCFCCR
jgi:hypothetical protein